MKRDYNQSKPQTVGSFLKKLQDKQNANDQIDRHNQRQGTTKINYSSINTYQNDNTAPHSMELSALGAIRQANNEQRQSIYPSVQQTRNAQEKEIIQNAGNLSSEKLSLPLHIKLIELKEENVERYNNEFLNHPNRLKMAGYYQQMISKESEEIEWLKKLDFNNFFNSEYVKGFGLYYPQNAAPPPLPIPPMPINPQQPDPEEEAMIEELRAQLAQMREGITLCKP